MYYCSSSSSPSAESPRIWILVPIMEWFQPLLPLPFADRLLINLLEVLWGDFEQPFWLNGQHLSHVLLGGHHQLVVDHPFRISVE